MKKTVCTALSILAGAVLLPDVGLAVNACSEGIGIPPFLSSGAKPNLLMVLDNSGSMLDSAYSETGSFCFDDTYNSETIYGGYFKKDSWYQWTKGAYAPWENGRVYAAGDRVYANGIVWEVEQDGGGTSSGTTVDDDEGVAWTKVYSLKKWANKTAYAKDDFVWSGPLLYRATNAGTSNDPDASNGLNLADDVGVVWAEADSTWLSGKAYAKGAIVSYKGFLYEAASSGTSSGSGLHDDKGLTWKRLEEGFFKAVDKDDALAFCSGADGADKHSHADLCVSLNKTPEPDQVSAFAARGNFLNWAMASKFDVEKKILTGGKHSYHDQMLISEHRGCSGSRAVKQIQMSDGKYLSLGVRSAKHSDDPAYEDRIDSTDDTGRLEVLAITDAGYQMSAACQAAIDKIINHGLKGSENEIQQCIESFPNADSKMVDMRPTLNHSLQACWQDDPNTDAFEINQGHWQSLIDDCYALYTGKQIGSIKPSRAYHPSELRPADGGPYLCYGVYDASLDHLNRVGYMGRVWNSSGSGGMLTCDPQKPAGECTGDPCYWKYSGGVPVTDPKKMYFKNEGGYVYECSKNNGSQCTGKWNQLFVSSDDGSLCDPMDPIFGGSDPDWEVSTWPDDSSVPAAPGNGILEAIRDYCDVLKVPEVIDPSGSAGKSGETGNAPALLRDSELMAFLGGKDPLSTMKGRIYQKDRPQGVVHNVAQDLRLGAMSFHYVGAKTECTMAESEAGSKLQKYCPLGNKDGAKLLAALETGDLVKATDSTYASGKRRHVDEVAAAVNDIRATSWTPLAEALYEAVGYYTQNKAFCLNQDGDGNCLDFSTTKDPVQYWCQDNHIIVITEGESTADVNEAVAKFVEDPSTHFVDKKETDDVSGDGDTNPQACDGGLYGSAYLDNMSWWGQHVMPLYKKRYVKDPDGNEIDKQNIFTHVVTTGSLATGGSGECSPETLMQNAAVNGGTNNYYPGENPQQLEDNLYAVLDDILSRSSSGSAASVISSSRSGSGAVYQAVFWPKFEDGDPDEDGTSNKVTWIGDVHALFVSSDGLMYEDTDQNGKLEKDKDHRVIFYFSSKVNKTRGCYEDLVPVGTPPSYQCADDAETPCTGAKCVEIQDINYVWSANRRLKEVDADDRKIYTWNDANNDGIVDNGSNEFFRLSDMTGAKWDALNGIAKDAGRGPVTNDFLTPTDWETFVSNDPDKEDLPDATDGMELDALNALIGWLQGTDQYEDEATDSNGNDRLDKALRTRKFTFKEGDGWQDKEWRLGDIIHSTPMAVAKPAESYHYLYRDPTYKDFVSKWTKRRTMVYFGGNDGMLHAVNGGFYSETTNQFCCNPVNDDGTCDAPPDKGSCGSAPDLGEEMWAYVPYNLQPHLKCLADKFYAHKYFVDLKPRIFDVQIFKADDEHPGGWGTILVGGMRFGGAPILASELNGGDPNDKREFTSAFFVLDITNPERAEPVLLGELNRTTDKVGTEDKYVDLNYTTAAPTLVIMRSGSGGYAESKWYLVMGNGPADLDGSNAPGKQALLAIFPLDRLQGKLSWGAADSDKAGMPAGYSGKKMSFRVPNQEPSGGSGDETEGGRFLVPKAKDKSTGNYTEAGYISDLISVDYNIDITADDTLGARYCTDAIYFGTTDGTDFVEYPSDYLPDATEQFHWKGGGRLFRMVAKRGAIDSEGVFQETASLPKDWSSPWTDNNDSKGPIRMLADMQMPVIAAPSIGYDGHNYWIYGGTGRFYSDKDKTDDGWCLDDSDATCDGRARQSFFGLKEPLKDAVSEFDGWNPNPPPNGNKATCENPVMTWAKIDWDITSKTNANLPLSSTEAGTTLATGKRGLIQTDNILVGASTGYLYCYNCKTDINDASKYVCTPLEPEACFPGGESGPIWDADKEHYTFDKLRDYIAGTGCQTNDASKKISTGIDGWYLSFHDPRERNLGTSALLGGLLTFTTYQPFNDKCKAEGQSYLYGVHFQTGTAWTDTVFGTFNDANVEDGAEIVMDKLSLGRGLSTTPSMHVGTGDQAAKAFIQTSTGEIIEIDQENLPIGNQRSGRMNWTDRCVE